MGKNKTVRPQEAKSVRTSGGEVSQAEPTNPKEDTRPESLESHKVWPNKPTTKKDDPIEKEDGDAQLPDPYLLQSRRVPQDSLGL
jgi:hypothetical protein